MEMSTTKVNSGIFCDYGYRSFDGDDDDDDDDDDGVLGRVKVLTILVELHRMNVFHVAFHYESFSLTDIAALRPELLFSVRAVFENPPLTQTKLIESSLTHRNCTCVLCAFKPVGIDLDAWSKNNSNFAC
jgi:hypothetical protein